MIWILIVAVVIGIILFIQYVNAEKKPKDKVRLYCGTMGSGKTYSAVTDSVSSYKSMLFRYKIGLLKSKPHFFSNIPIELRKLTKSEKIWLSNYVGEKVKCVDDVVKYSKNTGHNLRPMLERWGVLNEWLEKDHLFLRKMLPDNSCVLLDEMSVVADQYSHDIPEVREQLVFFIGFCRHWFLGKGGMMACTAQATDSIVKQVRSKYGVCILLNSFHRWALISPFYKVDCTNLLNADDVRVVDDKREAVKKGKPYYFGWLGYKKRFYNSRCYKVAYDEKFTHNPDFEYKLQTRYIIDVQCSKSLSKEYSMNREKFRSVLFDDNKQYEVEKVEDETSLN